MEILIVGRGWIGRKLEQAFRAKGIEPTVIAHTGSITYVRMLAGTFDWIVNCAGLTGRPNVDALEDCQFDTMEANAYYPVNLHAATEDRCRFAHWSSGCIYQGTIATAQAEPNFSGSTYSISKAYSDTALRGKALLWRVRMPFTGDHNPRNYLTKIRKYAAHAHLYDGGHNSITDIDEAVNIAAQMIVDGEGNNIHNLVNPGSVTMHDVVDGLRRHNLLTTEPKWWTAEEFQRHTKALRSNAVIPPCHSMTSVDVALDRAMASMASQPEVAHD